MIVFRFFRFIILFIFVFIISVSAFLFYVNKHYLNEENIRNYIIELIHEKTGMNITLGEIRFQKPDNFVLKNLTISDNERNEIFWAELVKINFNMTEFIKNFSLKPDFISIENSRANLIKKDGKWNFQKLNYSSDKTSTLPETDIKGLILNVKDTDSNRSYFADILALNLTKKMLSDEICVYADVNYESSFFKKAKITSSFYIPMDFSKIVIEWLKTEINGKKVEIEGTVSNFENSSSELTIKTSEEINLKDFLKINKDIIIDKFTAALNTKKTSDKILNFSSRIKKLNAEISVNYDTQLKAIESSEIKIKGVDINKLKEFVKEFIKDFSGNVDLEIKTQKNGEKTNLYITAYSQNISFKDEYELLNFKNAKIKLIINPSFDALNLIEAKASFPHGTIKGSLKSDSNYRNENIYAKFDLDNIKSKIGVKIKDKFRNRKFYIDIETSMFPFNKFYDIFNYATEKIQSKPSKKDSVYNMKEREVFILWNSANLTDNPYIYAGKLEIKSDIKSFNSYELMRGNFKIKATNGKMENIQQNMKNNDKYALIFLPITTIFSLNRTGALKVDSELKAINISDIGVDFDLNNAKIIINKFYLNSKEFLIYAKGSMDTKKEQIDMEVYIINMKDYKSGALPESLTDSRGRPALAFRIKGSLKNNEVKIFDATNITELVEKQVKESIKIN